MKPKRHEMNKIKPAALGKGQTGFGNDNTPKFTITPHSCIRFKKCSANVCPLDRDWELRTHVRGEGICLYMSEYAKPGGRAKLEWYIPAKLIEVIERVHTSIIERHADIKCRLKRASRTPSKLGKKTGKQMSLVA